MVWSHDVVQIEKAVMGIIINGIHNLFVAVSNYIVRNVNE